MQLLLFDSHTIRASRITNIFIHKTFIHMQGNLQDRSNKNTSEWGS